MANTEKPRLGLIARIIDASARKRVFVFGITIMLAIWGVVSATRSQLDALPDLSDTQVNVAARVTSTGNGFAVAIRADDLAVAQEVLDRARRSHNVRGDGGPVTTRNRP